MKPIHAAIPGSLLLASIAAPAATVVTLDEGPIAGHPSITIGADGAPRVAYETLTAGLRVATCRDVDCSDSIAIDIPDPPSGMSAGLYNSIGIAHDGTPLIAFKDTVDRQLKLVKCASADCTGGAFAFRTIDAGPDDVGAHVDMKVDGEGIAHFAYQDFNTSALVVARCQTRACIGVEITPVFDAGSVVYGENAALAIGESGTLAIASRWSNSAGDGAIHFMLCTVWPCIDPQHPIDYLIGHPVGTSTSMALAPGDLPRFAFHDDTDGTLDFAACWTADCTGTTVNTIDDVPGVPTDTFASVAVRPDGRAVVAYQRHVAAGGGSDVLYVAECDDVDCAASDRFVVDGIPGARTGEDPVVAIGADGGAVIAYVDQSDLSLKLAKCNAATCRGAGDRLFADGFE